MPLSAGIRVGPYEVISPAGAGGMGEVYRARDSRLNRDVALKVLPPSFARDPERLRRFQQEAQAAAALNHPNILAVHDFGEHDGSPYIVTEFLEGETLRDRLRAGGLPVRKAIEYAEQMARGLAAAHEKGIVHRDLKPENIFVTRDARVKILDFGLAKLTRPEAAANADAATLASQTEPGLVMGTVGYMSPEQVRGQSADPGSDLFSFGAILYEMLSGKRAFQRATSAETLTAILKEEPSQLSTLTASISPLLQQVVTHCLEKDPEQRFQSASDLSFALRSLHDVSTSSSLAVIETSHAKRARTWLRLTAEVALLGVALFLILRPHTRELPTGSMQASILPPPGDGFWSNLNQPAVISPDGRFLAMIAIRNGRTQLWLRRLDSGDAQPIAGSEDAVYPFWSPDSRFLAFFGVDKLKKVDVAGGSVTDLCGVGLFSMGGAWSPRGVIVFGTFGDALKQVPESGGTPERIPGVDVPQNALGHQWPVFLPDGQHFLYLEWRYATPEEHANTVWIGSLDGEKARRLPLDSTNVEYAAGYLLFARDGDLFAQKFDTKRGELKGVAVPVVRNIQYDRFVQRGAFTVSETGVLVYAPTGTGSNTELTWMDRRGKVVGTMGDPQQYIMPSISPDGRRVAVGIKPTNERERVWVYDVERGAKFPLEREVTGPTSYNPIWSPDGSQLAYRNLVGKGSLLYVQPSDGSRDEKQLGDAYANEIMQVTDWSRDGRYLFLEQLKFSELGRGHASIEVVRIDEPGKALLTIDNAETGHFSPDGHWLAYSDDETGQLYVTPFPGPGGRIAVTTDGAAEPRWRGDGQELFYVTDDLTLTSVQVRESATEFHVVSSQPLFRMQMSANERNYSVTRDGQRFLVTYRTHKEQAAPVTVITNWTVGLQSAPK